MKIFKLTWSREQDHGQIAVFSSYTSKRIERERFYAKKEDAEVKLKEIEEASRELGEVYSTSITEIEVIE